MKYNNNDKVRQIIIFFIPLVFRRKLYFVVFIFIGLCFAHSVVGVGLGTVFAMIGVGRVISVYQFAYDKWMI